MDRDRSRLAGERDSSAVERDEVGSSDKEAVGLLRSNVAVQLFTLGEKVFANSGIRQSL
jgi:hypothetical protein